MYDEKEFYKALFELFEAIVDFYLRAITRRATR